MNKESYNKNPLVKYTNPNMSLYKTPQIKSFALPRNSSDSFSKFTHNMFENEILKQKINAARI